MAFMRSDIDSFFLLGGEETTLQGNVPEPTGAQIPEDCFDLIGCPDISKAAEDLLENWCPTNTDIAHCEGTSDQDQDSNNPFETVNFGSNNPFLEVSQDVTGPVVESRELSQGFEDLEDFLATEYQHQKADAQFSQSQPAATPAPVEITKSPQTPELYSSPVAANSLLLNTSSSLLQSQNVTQPSSLSFATSSSSAMTLQIGALDHTETSSNNQLEDNRFSYHSGLDGERFLAQFSESESTYDFGANNPFDSHDDGFGTGYQLSDYSTTDLEYTTGTSQNNEQPHVHFEDSDESRTQDLALSHFGLGKTSFPSSGFSQLQNNSFYDPLYNLSDPNLDVDDLFENNSLSPFKNYHYESKSTTDVPEDNGISPSFLSTIPRTLANTGSYPLSVEGQTQLGLEIRKSIAGLNKTDFSRFAAKHGSLVSTRNTGTSANRDKPQGPAGAEDQFRVSKSDKPKKPRKDKRHFSYANVKVKNTLVYTPNFKNKASNPLNTNFAYKKKLITLLGQGDNGINRKRYQRDNLDVLNGLHPNVFYEKNPFFDANHPYQQEFTRVELNPKTGAPIMETRSGLCAYCEDIGFYELKNSCYSQHMSHSHGIYTDDYLTPDPLLFGRYQVSKKDTEGRKTRPRIRCHEGVVCPACFDVVEVRCWSSTMDKKPLSNYLRHFKEAHRVDKRRETFFNLHA